MNLDLSKAFDGAFDTFKVFDQLNISLASETLDNTPKSIWQILNHLVIWQTYQIKLLKGENTNLINEFDSWSCDKQIAHQNILNEVIALFNNQIQEIKSELTQKVNEIESISNRIRLFQELSSHLSFHLGEIILIRRQLKNYPLPHEMISFLVS
ncbi:hypothetical protein [Emticicia sp. BO119]|uniref:hypothetical protein n=1 Tax=Emticicia sp. BO119 TaxID=2757768 RepID=UPI0015F04005|nr:hypothetical protein [Emticicia sp. BO119]MBA4849944.1 hypothetical protein [Emticicia sp. BO119]